MDRGEGEAAAASAMRECRRALAQHGSTILREATGGATEIPDWRRYPEGEAYDPATHAQYFFHRHPAPDEGGNSASESGHFHLFLRAEGMPAGTAPLLLPEMAVANAPTSPQSAPLKRGERDEISHLLAIAIDWRGEPVRLFTTNRWVTGETWYRGEDVIRMLDCFELRGAGPSPLIDRWLNALVRLFRLEIAAVLHRRDAAVREWRWRWPRRGSPFEDPRLEIASSTEIDLEERLAAVEKKAPARPRPPSRLPRMAEGWGC